MPEIELKDGNSITLEEITTETIEANKIYWRTFVYQNGSKTPLSEWVELCSKEDVRGFSVTNIGEPTKIKDFAYSFKVYREDTGETGKKEIGEITLDFSSYINELKGPKGDSVKSVRTGTVTTTNGITTTPIIFKIEYVDIDGTTKEKELNALDITARDGRGISTVEKNPVYEGTKQYFDIVYDRPDDAGKSRKEKAFYIESPDQIELAFINKDKQLSNGTTEKQPALCWKYTLAASSDENWHFLCWKIDLYGRGITSISLKSKDDSDENYTISNLEVLYSDNSKSSLKVYAYKGKDGTGIGAIEEDPEYPVSERQHAYKILLDNDEHTELQKRIIVTDGEDGKDGREIELEVVNNEIVWRYVGGSNQSLVSLENLRGNGISNILTSDPVESADPNHLGWYEQTVTVKYTREADGTFKIFTKEGKKGETGNGIASITGPTTDGLIDTYTINYTDPTMDPTHFTVTNAKSITSIDAPAEIKTGSSEFNTYTINFNSGNPITFNVYNGEKGEKGTSIIRFESGTPSEESISGVTYTKTPINVTVNDSEIKLPFDVFAKQGIDGRGIVSITKNNTLSHDFVNVYDINFDNGESQINAFSINNGFGIKEVKLVGTFDPSSSAENKYRITYDDPNKTPYEFSIFNGAQGAKGDKGTSITKVSSIGTAFTTSESQTTIKVDYSDNQSSDTFIITAKNGSPISKVSLKENSQTTLESTYEAFYQDFQGNYIKAGEFTVYNGKSIEVAVRTINSEKVLAYNYTGETNYKTICKLEDLKGRGITNITPTETNTITEGNRVYTENKYRIDYSDGTNSTFTVKAEKGDKGDTGDTGAQGPKGDPGDKGDKGDTGDNIELRVDNEKLQWKTTSDDTWSDLDYNFNTDKILYTCAIPTTEKVGGIKANTTFNKTPVSDILFDMFHPYKPFTISSYDLQTSSNANINTSVEIGTERIASKLKITWTNGSKAVTTLKYKIGNGNEITYDGDLSNQSITINFDEAITLPNTSYSFTITLSDGETTITNTKTYTVMYNVYYTVMSDPSDLPDKATNLSIGNGTSITTQNNTYIVYFVPSSFNYSTIKEKTQLDASGWASLDTTSLGSISLENKAGYVSTYKVYKGPKMTANTGTYKIV